MSMDQAQRLRQLAAAYRTDLMQPTARGRVLAVTSGKGGVGKTNLAVNLAYALSADGRRVTVLDADLGLANADILVGASPQRHLGHFLRGECELEQVILPLSDRLRLIPGGSGLVELAELSDAELTRLTGELRRLEQETDYLILDTGAGLGRQVLRFLQAADEVLLVTTPEPTALADAYGLLKALTRVPVRCRVRLVLNQTRDSTQAAARLIAAAQRFLHLRVELMGTVPWDPAVGRAVAQQRPFCLASPQSPAARAVARLARELTGQTVYPRPGGFFARLRHAL